MGTLINLMMREKRKRGMRTVKRRKSKQKNMMKRTSKRLDYK